MKSEVKKIGAISTVLCASDSTANMCHAPLLSGNCLWILGGYWTIEFYAVWVFEPINVSMNVVFGKKLGVLIYFVRNWGAWKYICACIYAYMSISAYLLYLDWSLWQWRFSILEDILKWGWGWSWITPTHSLFRRILRLLHKIFLL